MTMHGTLHPQSNVSRLYTKVRGQKRVSINFGRKSLQCHVSSTQEKLLKVAQTYIKSGELHVHVHVGPKEYKNQRREEEKKQHEIGRKNHFTADS